MPLAKTNAATKKASKAAADNSEVRIFVSYSHVDSVLRGKLETHLAVLKRENVATWYDGDLNAGEALDANIARELRRAHLFIALISPDYLASNYCWKLEYTRAMNRRARGSMHVVAIILRPCDWKATNVSAFKLLPKDGKAVTKWKSADDALLDVTQGVRRVVQAIRKARQAAGASLPQKRVGTAKKAVATTAQRTSKAPKPKPPARKTLQSKAARPKTRPSR